jgi:integrase
MNCRCLEFDYGPLFTSRDCRHFSKHKKSRASGAVYSGESNGDLACIWNGCCCRPDGRDRIDQRQDNPTTGTKRIKSRTDGFHTWTEEEISQFEAVHPVGGKARLALALLLYTAQRRSDVVGIGRQHIRNGVLHIKQKKTSASLAIPVHPELARIIAATPSENLTLLTTSFRKTFTAAGLGIGSVSSAIQPSCRGIVRLTACGKRPVDGSPRPIAPPTGSLPSVGTAH